MAKIKLSDTMMDILMKLSEGNPGAVTVLVNLAKEGDQIDPDAFSGHLGVMLDLDTLGIYGSGIWVVYKDICRCSMKHFIAIFRARQLGLLSENDIKTAIQTNTPSLIDADKTLQAVQQQLPNFAK